MARCEKGGKPRQILGLSVFICVHLWPSAFPFASPQAAQAVSAQIFIWWGDRALAVTGFRFSKLRGEDHAVAYWSLVFLSLAAYHRCGRFSAGSPNGGPSLFVVPRAAKLPVGDSVA